jgi:hypothetical protein
MGIDINLDLDLSEALAKLEALEAQLEALDDLDIDIDLDIDDLNINEESLEKLRDLDLGDAGTTVSVDIDEEDLERITWKVRGAIQSGRTSVGASVSVDAHTNTAWSQVKGLQNRIEDLTPEIKIGADTIQAEAEIARLKLLLEDLDTEFSIDARGEIDEDSDGARRFDLGVLIDNLEDLELTADNGPVVSELQDANSTLDRIAALLARLDSEETDTIRSLSGASDGRDILDFDFKNTDGVEKYIELLDRLEETQSIPKTLNTGGLHQSLDRITDKLNRIETKYSRLQRRVDRDGDDDGDTSRRPDLLPDIYDRDRLLPDVDRGPIGRIRAPKLDYDIPILTNDRRKDLRRLVRLRENLDAIGEGFSNLRRRLAILKPTFGKIYQLTALISPILGVMATQAIGVAAALGAVGAAGAAVLGLGLFGDGATLEIATENAEQKLKDFKKELYQVFQPTARAFAPITDQFLAMVPDRLDGIARSLQGLTVYEDTFYFVFGQGIELIEGLIDRMIRFAPAFDQITRRLTGAAPTFFLDLLDRLVEEGYRNQDMLFTLAGAGYNLIRVLFAVSKVVARVITAFAPLTSIILFFAQLLSTKVGQTVAVAVTMIGLLVGAAYALGTAFLWVASGGLGSAISSIITMIGLIPEFIAMIWSLNTALGVTATLLSALTLGLAAIGAVAGGAMVLDQIWNQPSLDDPASFEGQRITQSSGGGERGGDTVINVYGDMDEEASKRVVDVVRSEEHIKRVRSGSVA